MKKLITLCLGLLIIFLVSSTGFGSPGIANKTFKVNLCEKVSTTYVAPVAVNTDAGFIKLASDREHKAVSYNCNSEIVKKPLMPHANFAEPEQLLAINEKITKLNFKPSFSYRLSQYVMRASNKTAKVGKRYVKPFAYPLNC